MLQLRLKSKFARLPPKIVFHNEDPRGVIHNDEKSFWFVQNEFGLNTANALSSKGKKYFLFRKVISVDRGEHSGRRRALAKMLTPNSNDPKAPKSSLLTFTLVSEPPGEPYGSPYIIRLPSA